MSEHDSPWKEVLDRYFDSFVAFFFPHIHQAIDWSRGHETLDKELQQVMPDAETGRRTALPPLKHGSWVYHATFSPDDRFIATASFDRDLRICLQFRSKQQRPYT